MTAEMVSSDIAPRLVNVNGRWPLWMPPHRAERPEWHTPPYWEGKRLDWMASDFQGLMVDLFSEHPVRSQPPTIWDVGAEEGDMPALYASWGADVVLIEPNPKVWPCIRYHWRVNNLPGPAGCYVGLVGHQSAVHDPEGGVWTDGWPECSLGDMTPGHGFHHLWEHGKVDSVATLDQMLEWFPTPDIITADIEGGEGHMLAGAVAMLADVRPTWFVSVHRQFLADLYDQAPEVDVLDVFSRHGYTAELIDDHHEQHWVFTP